MCANRVSSKISAVTSSGVTPASKAADDLAKKNLDEFAQTAVSGTTSTSQPPVASDQPNLGHPVTVDTGSQKSNSNESLDELWDRLFADRLNQPIDYSYLPPDSDTSEDQETSSSTQNSSLSGQGSPASTDPAPSSQGSQATSAHLNPFEDPNYHLAPIPSEGNPFSYPPGPYAAPTADGQAVPQLFGTTNSLPPSSGPVTAPQKAFNSGHFTVSLDNPFFQGTEAISEQSALGTNPSFSANDSCGSPVYNRPPSNESDAVWPDPSFEATLFPNGRPNVSNPANGASPIDPSFEATLFTNGRPSFVNADGSPANIPPVSANNPFSPGYEHRNHGLFCMAMHEYALGLCQQLGLPPQLLSGLLDFYLDNAIDAYKKAVDVYPDMPLDPQTEKTAALARRATTENYVQHQITLFGKDAFKPTFDPLTKKNGDEQTSSLTQDDVMEYSSPFSTSEQQTLTSSFETIKAYQNSQQQIPKSTEIDDSDDGSNDAGEGSEDGDTDSDATLIISATKSDQSQVHSISQTQTKSESQTGAQSTDQPLTESQIPSTKQQPASKPVPSNKNAVVNDGTAKWVKKYPDRSDKAVHARVAQLQTAIQAEMVRPFTNDEKNQFNAIQQIHPQQTEQQFRKDYLAKKVRDGALTIVLGQIADIAKDRNDIVAGRIQLADPVKQKQLTELNEIDDYLNKVSQAFWAVQI